jgi:uncharacterized membrane protein
VAASVASVIAVAFVLGLAGRSQGAARMALIALGAVTAVLSWTVVNTVFTLRYADLYFASGSDGIDFGMPGSGAPPEYRDFAYLAFTIGMTYQVSDTDLTSKLIRSSVLRHALLSYMLGAVILAATINLVAGLAK